MVHSLSASELEILPYALLAINNEGKIVAFRKNVDPQQTRETLKALNFSPSLVTIHHLAPGQFLLLQGIAAQVMGDFRATLKGNLKDLFADVEVIGGEGEVIAFASSVDNGTGDQLFKLQ